MNPFRLLYLYMSITKALWIRKAKRKWVYSPASKRAWAALRATRFRPSDRAPSGLAASRINRAQGRG